MSRFFRLPKIVVRASGLALAIAIGGFVAHQAFGAANNFTGTLNATGKVCVGSAGCDATYVAATDHLEVIDTSSTPIPSIGLMNAKDNATPTLWWEMKADTTGLSFNNHVTSFTPLFLDTVGRVGLGTTSPGAKLSIIGSQALTNIFLGNNNADTHLYRTQFATDPTGFALGTTVDSIVFNNAFTVGLGAPTASLAVTSAGRVGVGNAAPQAPMQVGAGSAGPLTAGATLLLEQNSAATSMVMKSNLGPEMFLYQDQNNGLMGTATNTPFGLRSNNATRLWVGANGNIGIGPFLVAPTARLEFDTGANSDGVTWNNASSRSLKQNFAPADSQSVLEKLASLPMQTWNYKSDPATLHLGPTAEDFQAAFGLGSSDKSISTLDMEGVTATAVQGLYRELKDRDARIAALESRLADLEGSGGRSAVSQSVSAGAMPPVAVESTVSRGGPGWVIFAGLAGTFAVLFGLGYVRLASRLAKMTVR